MKRDLIGLGLAGANVIALFAGKALLAPATVRFLLKTIKSLGLFHVARYLTRDGLRIICYHGFAVADEYKYRGRLFIREELFRRRVEYLQRKRYPILPLSEAITELGLARLPPCATVITMDDGWQGVCSVALPIIKEFQIPVTVYVTTYYVEHPMPVFTVTLSYLFWCTKIERVDLPRGLGTFHLGSEAEKAEGLALEFGNCLAPLDRLQFLKEVAEALDVPFSEIERQQLFRVVDAQQLRQLADAGVDIQLHSHRHRWSAEDGRATVEAEVADNRRFLERIVSHRLEHFCYPSGVYASHHGEWLASLGVKSATTIDPGLNYADTPKFALRRLMDGHPVSDIEFEAEVTGVMEIVRAVRERRLCSMLFRRFGARPEISHPEDDKGPQKMGASVIEAAPRWGADFYDRLHTEADCPETPALYKPLFRQVVKTLGDCGSRTVLEVGCGSGFLAEMILREHAAAYRGFDFSLVAIRNAGRRTGHPELFARADALDPRSYACDYDTIVCTEVLEHIDADLDVIRLWRDGALCVCTVPNFDFDSHVRYFRRSEEVVVRYGDLVDIRAVIRVARPIIPDGCLRSYLRNLRWSRDDPSRFLGFMGIQTFDRLGGWFLFFGAKKHQGR